jgi:hypothetical protein
MSRTGSTTARAARSDTKGAHTKWTGPAALWLCAGLALQSLPGAAETPCPQDRLAPPAGQAPCGGGPAVPYAPRSVEAPPLTRVDLSHLPKDSLGRPILMEGGAASLALERQAVPGPVNILAGCSVLVSRCVKPGERDLDSCFRSAPRCGSDRPWEIEPYTPCCPPLCQSQYESRRRAGMPPLAAFDETLFGDDLGQGSCIPPGHPRR